jgi:hypothetical protein
MKHLSSAAVLAVALLTAAPACAETLTEQGVTREKMVAIMTRHGLPARIDKDSKGNVIVKSRDRAGRDTRANGQDHDRA